MLEPMPFARLGEASDITWPALIFCSPASAWVSGQVLTVSGGGVQELDWNPGGSCGVPPPRWC